MYPRINNKELIDCDTSDFSVLLDNPDYRENQHLEYKEDFSFKSCPKDHIASKIIEFRNDICSFANAEGGYIIYGIRDDQGLAEELCGVDIDNPDKFELEIRNKLTPVQPKIPTVQIRFLQLSNGRYLVIVLIENDYYAPYIHLEDQKNYKIYKRDGNQKIVMSYTEIRKMFVKAHILGDEIFDFRKRRIKYFQTENPKDGKFLLFHIIPESFLSDRKDLFILERKNKLLFSTVFAGAGIEPVSLPCVDGLRFYSRDVDAEAMLYNHGTEEYVLQLKAYVLENQNGLRFYYNNVWEKIDCLLQGYRSVVPPLFGAQRYFACISIIGCKGAVSEENGYGRDMTTIDRNEINCQPIAFTNMEDQDAFDLALKKLHLEYLLSIGIRNDKEVSELIEGMPCY